jgi:hypothetical protein
MRVNRVAVLFMIFNRPELTLRVFEEIRRYAPARLYIAADGPRPGIARDKGDCLRAREVAGMVDWDCEVKTLLRDSNLGCRAAVSSAIDWFFQHEEEGVILEDDALPGEDFFRFCAELLERYRFDTRVTMISGDKFLSVRKRLEYSYSFSRYTLIWGWASWRRAWRHCDFNMKLWPEVRDKKLLFNVLDNRRQVAYWSRIFERSYKGETNAWSHSWLLATWLQDGLVILPRVNLVSNIGFGQNSTHTRGKSVLAGLGTGQIDFPLKHPPFVLRDKIGDRFIDKRLYSYPRIYKKIINILYGR